MIRYAITCVAAIAIAAVAFGQQAPQQADEQQVRAFMTELAQDLGKDADAYMERISFPVQISVVTADGELLSGSFEENEFKLLGYLPGDHIRLHTAQQVLMRQAREMGMGQRAAADEDMNEEAMPDDEMVVEEELALMPREKVVEQAQIRTVDTQVQFLNENAAFVRTTLSIGEEMQPAVGAADRQQMQEDELAQEEQVVEEELAVRPQPEQAHFDFGALLIRENGEWKVKSIVTGDVRLHQQQQ